MYNFYRKISVPPIGGTVNTLLKWNLITDLFTMAEKRNWIMRLNIVAILLTVGILQVSANSLAQKITLSEKNAQMVSVFNKIRVQTGYDFLFTSEILKDANKITINVKNASFEEVLEKIFAGQPFEFRIENQSVILSRKEEKKVFFPKTIITPNVPIDVSGTITDEKKSPLPGASVKVKGTTRAAVTNSEGKFAIVVEKDDILVISFVGYKTKEVPVNGQTRVDIQLEENAADLAEQVIIGYGSTKKVNLTGAVSTISGDVLNDRPIANIGRGIQGLLPGLNVTSSNGQPGTGSSFNIRGFTSVNGGSPLILVDGVPTGINNLNPGDVESVTVLKDAASAAVYGSRAPFGVVLITTKKGKKGTAKIAYSANYSINKITHGMEDNIVTDPGTVVDYTNMSVNAYNSGAIFAGYTPALIEYAHKRSKDLSLPSVIVSPDDASKYLYVGNTNWYHELYAPTNSTYNHNLSVTGGGDKLNYYFSGGYNRQNGVFRYSPDYYNRYNLRTKLDYQATKWLNLYTNMAYNRTQYNSASLWSSDIDGQFGDIYHAAGRNSTLSTLKNPDGSWAHSGPYLGRGGTMIGFMADGGRSNSVTNQTQNTLGFTTSFFGDKLRVKGDYTFRSTNDYNRTFHTILPYEDAPDRIVKQFGSSDASNTANNISYHTTNVYTEYENTFAEKHYLKAMVGASQELNDFESFGVINTNLISSQVGYINQTTGVPKVTGADAYQWAVQGLFSRINYIYDDKYLLELDGRYDGSSRFPVNSKYAFFPGVSVGWRVSEESFFKGLKNVVSNLKFRASYGSLGNDQSLGNYDFIPTLSSGNIAQLLGGVQPRAVYNSSLIAPSLTWEKVYTKNFGVDMTVAKNIDMTFELYQRDTKNMITTGFQLPAVLGNSQPKENAADLRTRGWELSLAYHNQFTLAAKPFAYNFRVNLWDNNTVITRYNNPTGDWFSNGYYKGQTIGDVWGLNTLGMFQTDAEGKAWADQSKLISYYSLNVAGELKWADLNNDGKIDYGDGTISNPGDARVIANTSPRYGFGFSGQFSWNNFDLGVIFQGVLKRDWIPTSGYYWGIFNAPYESVQKNIIGNTWTPETPNAFYPTLKTWRSGDAGPWKDLAVPQTRYTLNAAYIRLKNLNIGYSVTPDLLKKVGIDRIRIYASGENLWEYTKLPKIFDPEGLDGSWGTGKVYPFQRAFSFGLDVRF